MATNFFQRQDDARQSTGWLIVLFLVGVVGIALAVGGVAAAVMHFTEIDKKTATYPWEFPIGAGLVALLLIAMGTLYKVVLLRNGGGASVAEHLGGRRLYPDATELHERRLLNVVDEMALAAGVPAPPVYVLPEEGINAFAAGYSPSDAVIGVTRGAIDGLSREELQGVIAHEFSHILNGDMRMNIRLIGILHGILLLTLIGYGVFRAMAYGAGSSRGGKKGGGAAILVILGVAIALIVLGYIGNIIGGLIKAAVSRQREYLADASAVQFTRNPHGIGGALMRIGGAAFGSRLKHHNASEASHMYFATGVWEGFTSLMATHPPLEKRIRAIDPQWDGKFLPPRREAPRAAAPRGEAAAMAGAAGLMGAAGAIPFPSASAHDSGDEEVPPGVMDRAAEQIGAPTEEHREYAAALLSEIPGPVLQAVHEPYGARAVVYCLLLDDDPEVRQKQMDELAGMAEPDIVEVTRRLTPHVDATHINARLPLVDLSLSALRALSQSQYDRFRQSFWALVKADERLNIFEWTLAQVLMRHLDPHFQSVRSPRVHYYGIQRLGKPISVLLSALAHAGHPDGDPAPAFHAGAAQLPDVKLTLLPPDQCGLRALHPALEKLATVVERHRGRVIDACAETILYDRHVTRREGELLRGISDLLECPMPPLIAGQRVGASHQPAPSHAP